jgi:hypothetical protein
MKNGVFWDVTPCGSCKNRRFGTHHDNGGDTFLREDSILHISIDYFLRIRKQPVRFIAGTPTFRMVPLLQSSGDRHFQIRSTSWDPNCNVLKCPTKQEPQHERYTFYCVLLCSNLHALSTALVTRLGPCYRGGGSCCTTQYKARMLGGQECHVAMSLTRCEFLHTFH